MEQSPSWEVTGYSVWKIPAYYWNRRFITSFTTADHLFTTWARSIQSMPHPKSWRSILTFCSHLRLGFASAVCPSGFFPSRLCMRFPSPPRATCTAHFILLVLITRTILNEEYRSWSSSLWNLKIHKLVNTFHHSVQMGRPVWKKQQNTTFRWPCIVIYSYNKTN